MREASFYLLDENSAKDINSSEFALDRFLKRSNHQIIYIKNISTTAANILKQDAISVGAIVLNHKNTILGGEYKYDSILLVDSINAKDLANKLKLQQFSCIRLSKFLNELKISKKYPKIMGIMNINDDSFYESSRISEKEFLAKAYEFIENGASIIDIGAMSSRPNSTYLGAKLELDRLKPIFNLIKEHRLCDKIDFSLDSFDEICLTNALDIGFKYINDISANTKLSKLALKYDATYILMHSQNNYFDNYINNTGLSNSNSNSKFFILDSVYEFFLNKLSEIESKVIIDVGIGFGKSEYENLVLVKYLNHFKTLNKPILLAASNKRFLGEHKEALSLITHANSNADYIRVHDVIGQNAMINYLKKMESI
ncbi:MULTISPECIES: dihydropteroate synthase [unclassified Campylobacter]|uniref:dihydropteroate synthase n=1 Tax=unclassified Campylobacter TaxID=2593542 RepID=UPI001DD7DE0C|nr:dihydropteroate synthase [Campylobacter sp. RM9331]MBZ8006387.1 dihydropteroate synthase [Campylobacter sp. RM9332]